MKPKVPIKPMLEAEGYPFKSKMHSKILGEYQRLGKCKTVVKYLGNSINGESYKSSFLVCPQVLRYQFSEEFKIKVSDKCCLRMKEKPLSEWAKANNKTYFISGIARTEGGRRFMAECLVFEGEKFKAFQPLAPITKEWEEWFIKTYKIDISDIYKPPYNFLRTGCKGCPYAIELQKELDTLEKFFPEERKQCEIIWKPVYEEYRRLNYRLKQHRQMELKDYL